LIQTRHEIMETEATSLVSPDELGWLGRLRWQQQATCPGGGRVSRVTCPWIDEEEPPLALVKCLACGRVVLSARLHVHRRQCDPGSASAAAAAAAEAAAHHRPLARPAAGYGGGKKNGGGGGGASSKKKGQSKAAVPHAVSRQPLSLPLLDGTSWMDNFVPEPVNLGELAYPYIPQGDDLVGDFLANLIDRFVFPVHLRRAVPRRYGCVCPVVRVQLRICGRFVPDDACLKAAPSIMCI
jgi:hypothetical protein